MPCRFDREAALPTIDPTGSRRIQPGCGFVESRRDGRLVSYWIADQRDADEEEDAFHDASRDVPEREDLVLPLEERDQHNRGADVRDDQDQLQDRPEVDAVVGTASGDVALGIVENGLKELKRWDRGDEGDQVQRPESQRNPFVCAHLDPSRRGHGRRNPDRANVVRQPWLVPLP